ncbi:hypothetical protein [Psittacicella gerlachiana]|uniref:Aldose 1-epimerase n=1 Tax=Psittacicella gerlachiana TaxID=2028574 RepID=A0A3A1YI64_9GAMM|nr:hypothetical protein [Psittacicella gerlachiana]RIY36730.1 hypothetical protein CKF59_02415 [Psittacicella gerlachiana]
MQQIEVYTLKNTRQTKVEVLNLGGAIHKFCLEGNDTNLVVSCSNLEEYLTNPFNINLQIGRVAGRIAQAQFSLNHELVQLPANHGTNCLHGGEQGMAKQWFVGKQLADNHLQLSTNLYEQVDSFPGDLAVTIDYYLSEDNELKITYRAKSLNKWSVFDPTAHIYWRTFDNEQAYLTIDGSHMQTDDQAIPQGLSNKANYQWSGRSLAQGLAEIRTSEQPYKGFDEVYHVNNPLVATLEVSNHYKLEVFSSRNALVIFTADPVNWQAHDRGEFSSIALEPQTMPNSLNARQWGDICIEPRQEQQTEISFKVTKI